MLLGLETDAAGVRDNAAAGAETDVGKDAAGCRKGCCWAKIERNAEYRIDAAGCGNTVDAVDCRNRCCWVYVETKAAGCRDIYSWV